MIKKVKRGRKMTVLKFTRIIAITSTMAILGVFSACTTGNDDLNKVVDDYPVVENEEETEEEIKDTKENTNSTKTENTNNNDRVFTEREYLDFTVTKNTEMEFDKNAVMDNITKVLDEEGYEDTVFSSYSEDGIPMLNPNLQDRHYINSRNNEDGININYISVVIDEYIDSESALEDYPGNFNLFYQMEEDEVEDGITLAYKIGEDSNGGFGYQVFTVKGRYIINISIFIYKTPSFRDEDEEPLSEVDIDYYTFKKIMDENNIAYSIPEEEKYGFYE